MKFLLSPDIPDDLFF